MKFSILLSIVLIGLCLCSSMTSFAQGDEEYPSKERDKYYKNRTTSWTPYVPIDSNKILEFDRPQITLKTLEEFTPFESIYSFSPLQDSISNIISPATSIDDIPRVNGIFIGSIIKVDTTDSDGYILYKDAEYDETRLFNIGYWIAIKNEQGWNKYYTGLSANTPLQLKWNSRLDLIKDKNTLQIESCLLRLLKPHGDMESGPGPKYELIKDGLVTEFLLDSLVKDSDKDGLTDIVERKMMLNPKSTDTDQDGINDYLDLNPRFKSKDSKRGEAYRILLQKIIDCFSYNPMDTINQNTVDNHFKKGMPTFLIVTDDDKLKSSNPESGRFIFLSSKEYENYKEYYTNTLVRVSADPVFKVDKKKDTYIIEYSSGGAVYSYLLSKQKNEWELKILTIIFGC